MAELDSAPEEEGALPEFFRHQLDAAGAARLDLRRQGMADLAALPVDGSARWVSIGPSQIDADTDPSFVGAGPNAGVVADIAIDPSGASDAIVLVASGYGGVWRTTDGGLTWAPTMDALPSLSIGALAIEGGNPATLYAGGGTLYNLREYAVHFGGAGLYKSLDGGFTWFVADGGANATIFERLDVNHVVSPAAGLVFVGTSAGLYYSVDGGLNFGANHPGHDDGNPLGFAPAANAIVTSLTLDTTSPATKVWVALSGAGIFTVTINADKSVTLTGNLLSGAGAPVPGTFSDIQFAQGTGSGGAPAPDHILYASVQFTSAANTASFVGLYKSTDGGGSWNNTAGLAARLGTSGADQSDYDFAFGVDPQKAERVYAGFKEVWRSDDVACSFPETTSCGANKIHYDQHVIAFSPSSHWGAAPAPPTTIYAGNDGGLVRSQDGGSTWQSLNDGVVTAMFYGIDIGRGNAANNAYSYGGAQDNGNSGHRPGDVAEIWHQGYSGDGGHLAVDPADPQIVYGFATDVMVKTIDAGATWWASASTQVRNVKGATFATPIVIEATGHGFVRGNLVVIAGVAGNTNANGTWIIDTVPDANHFSLFGSHGNAVCPAAGGTATRFPRGDATITGATAATPIVITTNGHPYVTGDQVVISGVLGNVAANGTFTITRMSPTQFSLNGSVGTVAYVGGGSASGPGVGRGLSNPGAQFQFGRVGLVANGGAPAETIFVSEGAQLLRSADRGTNFAPVTAVPAGTGDANITALCVFDATHLWVGLANGSVHFSADGGATWDAGGIKTSPGPTRQVSCVAVDPANPQRVAVGYSGYAEISARFRTGSCFLSSDGGANWSDASGVDGGLGSNLPDLPLHDLVFDSSSAPSALIAATDGAVVASADAGAHWTRLGTDLPAVSCMSLAIDNAVTPRLLRVGTFGRGAFELTRPAAATIVVDGSLGFGAVPTNGTRAIVLTVRNPGAATLTITNFHRVAGSAQFTLQGAPAFPLQVPKHGSQQFTVAFAPSADGVATAGFTIENDDASASLFPLLASGQGVSAGKARLAIRADLNFGNTTDNAPRDLDMQLSNGGLAPLTITAMSRSSGSGDFALVGAPALPLTLAPGASQAVTVRYSPGSSGAVSADFRIDSNDPRQPQWIVSAKGVGVTQGSDALKTILIILGVALLAGGAAAGIAYAASKR
jgi:hypothetical protein